MTCRIVPRAPVLAMLLGGCAIPQAGPMATDLSISRVAEAGADLTPLSNAVVETNQSPRSASFPPPLLTGSPIDPALLAKGDALAISIFEGPGGEALMRSESSGRTDLEEIVVDPSGRIMVPYVGIVAAAGRRTEEVRLAIMNGLRRRTLNPQVMVRVSARRGLLVSVQGIVAKPGAYPLDVSLIRLVDLLAIASIAEPDSEQVRVVIRRGSATNMVRLADVFRDPAQNIALQSGDAVFVTKVREMLTVLGAAGVQGRVEITGRNFSLIDALASVRGANDDLADPRGVFLFRESRVPGARPHIYQLDLRDPGALLLAARFQVRDGDAIYISNARFAQTRKVLAVLASTFAAARVASAVAP